MTSRVEATPEALEIIQRLRAAHGPLVLHQSGGCCEGSATMCLLASELPPGPHDLVLGHLGDVPFAVDADQDRRWKQPRYVLDVAPGSAEGFSLEGSHGVHFLMRTEA